MNSGKSTFIISGVSKRKHRLLWCLILLFIQFLPISSFAQYTKLLDFGNTNNGSNPYGTPISDGTFLYGMTTTGGTSDSGTIYKMKLDGSGFTKLLDFNGTNGSGPYGSLYSDGTFLYGMTSTGGLNGYGIIFKVKPDGSGFVDMFDFDYNTTGSTPFGSLISVGGFLYGMTLGGGSHGAGTIFKILPDGTGYSKLFDFDYFTIGGYPYGSLYSDGTFLYGMTSNGISNSYGTIFKIKTDGTSYTDLLDFNIANGSNPKGSLISDGTFLYGMTFNGGTNGEGVIFKIMPDGSSFSKIVDFDYSAVKGAYPAGSLVYDGTFLYGTTTQNFAGNGTVFKVKTDGSSFTKLLDQDVYVGGPNPEGTLLWDSASTLYGVRSGLTINNSGLGYLGAVYKINTDGSNYTKLVNYEATGSGPAGSLATVGAVQSILYGTTSAGGLYNYGTVFKVNSDGTGYVKLLDFDDSNNGRYPMGRLTSDGTFLYGMTSIGGANGYGTIFKIKPDGTGYVKLLDFDGTNNGLEPNGSITYDGTYLYGMTNRGGSANYGTIFKILPDGTGYIKLHDLAYTTDGAYPNGSISVGIAGVLYGLTSDGGINDAGTLFKVNSDGTGFANLFNFNISTGSAPNASLYYDGTFLYGTTSAGGANSDGTIFKIKPDGSGYATLLDFDGTNSGSAPKGSLFSDGTFLYGMASNGGAQGEGTLFKMKLDGTGFIKLLDFSDGGFPGASLISDGTFLYGMTPQGGANGLGILFKITTTPFVSISDFSPGQGSEGTIVTINGTDFDPVASNNAVKFNNVTAIVKSSTSTSIVAIVPTGATTGPISVTATTTGISSANFTVIANAPMFNGSVQSCNVQFTAPTGSYIQANHYNPVVETFLPVNPTDKVRVSFASFSVPDDALNVYDGPDTSSPLIISLNGNGLPADIVATGPGGELTFEFVWADGASSSCFANISCQSSSQPIIATQTLATQIGGKVTLDLKPLIATSNLDLTSLQVITPPPSGASARIDAYGILTVDYAGKNFVGTETITIKACDVNGSCAQQDFSIDVVGDIIVYNGISPNGVNPKLIIEYIDILPDTKNNTVNIFDRWENPVWHGNNYDNSVVVFTGMSDGGSSLPSGVYFYKIEFSSGHKTLTGFISLRRQ